MTARSERYGKLVPAPNWRTTPERIEAMKIAADELGLTVTGLMELATDSIIEESKKAFYMVGDGYGEPCKCTPEEFREMCKELEWDNVEISGPSHDFVADFEIEYYTDQDGHDVLIRYIAQDGSFVRMKDAVERIGYTR